MLKSKANWQFIKGQDTNDSIIEALLRARGIEGVEEREKFLKPKLDDIQSPSYLAQIDRLKERIEQAIVNEERVIVYGDYDADGVTSTTLLVKTFREMGVNCQYYIPNRFTEGYGLNQDAIESFAEENVDLLITVDTGIADVVEVNYAMELGIDVVITDHHEVQDELPQAYAIIHPALSPQYEFKSLAGVGVAWQIAHYLIGDKASNYLDLAAIGTVADLVPLIGENRILVAEGLKKIPETSMLGLQKLLEICKLKGQVTERDIGFIIGPRLNAVGRMQNAMLAVQLLLTEDPDEAQAIAEEIEALNSERQKIVQQIVKEADSRVDEADSFILLADENWHEGVLGIAASRLVNTYHRPVMLLTGKKGEDQWKGSARSVAGFNLFEACMKIKELFTNFGGHSQAAGMTFPKENLESIKKALNLAMERDFTGEIGRASLRIHHTLTVEQMTEELVHEVDQLAPFGIGNERPLFHLKAVPADVRRLGQENRHLKLQFKHSNGFVEAIGFQFGAVAPYIAKNSLVSLVGELQLNEWNGLVTVQMNIQDIAVDEWQLFDYRGKRHISNLLPYVHHYEKNMILCHKTEELKEFQSFDHIKILPYHIDIAALPEVDLLYLYDLPTSLEQLIPILQKTKPQSVHVAFHLENGGLLHTRPDREQFKKVYIYLASFDSVPLKEHYPQMIRQTNLRKEQLSFILQVFYDLNIIFVENNVVRLNREAEKTTLSSSKIYQERVKQEEVEEILYYSSQEELKQWLLEQIEREHEEEVFHEL